MSALKRPRMALRATTTPPATSAQLSVAQLSPAQLVWKRWCRLCAKEDSSSNTSIFCKSEHGDVMDSSLATSIGKYFWVNINPNDQSPTFICTECHTLVTLLCSFTERVSKVQGMYCVLQNASVKDPVDPYDLRFKYGLSGDKWEHIIKLERNNVVEHVQTKEPKDTEHEEDVNTSLLDGDVLELNNDLEEESQEEEYSFEFADDAETEMQLAKRKCDDTATDEYNENEAEDDYLSDTGTDENEDQRRLERELSELDGTYTEEDIENDIDLKPKDEDETYDENDFSADNEEQADEEDDTDEGTEKKEPRSAQVNEIDSSSGVVKRKKSSTRVPGHYRYQCSICGKKYKNPTPYRKHMTEAHHTSPDIPDFKCEKCGKVLPTDHQLYVHSRTHLSLEDKLDIPCPYCNRKFTKLAVMKQHIRGIHQNMKPYICDECGRELKTLAALTEHKLVHTNDTPFKCDECQKAFKNKARLKVHLETHTETVYVCSECGLKLNTRRTLKMHMLVHSDNKRYKCDFCGSAFKRAKALKNHLILHTGMRPYKCNFCEKTFSNGSNCRSHKKKVHPVELAREAAMGKKTEVVTVPKLEELRSSTSIVENPRQVQRHVGGLSLRMRQMLIAAEERAKRADAQKKKNAPQDDNVENSAGIQRFVMDSNTINVETDEVAEVVEVDEVEDEEDGEEEGEGETVIYEIIAEI